jgi:hypothetical protein
MEQQMDELMFSATWVGPWRPVTSTVIEMTMVISETECSYGSSPLPCLPVVGLHCRYMAFF